MLTLKHPKIFILLGLLLLTGLANAQKTVLDGYIREAWQNNHGIREKQFQAQKAEIAVDEARRLNLPTATFGVNYSLAAGGRSISLPIGDLLNPVYNTLNEITGSNEFSTLENVEEQFLPNNFYDAKVRVVQPIFNRDIYYNQQIKKEQAALQGIDINQSRRQLARDIKLAYFQYLQAAEAIRIYQSGLELLAESKRVNQSLVNNGTALPGVLIRLDGETSALQAQLDQAQVAAQNAAAYFNHLLQRDYTAPIIIDSLFLNTPERTLDMPAGSREELQQLESAARIHNLVLAQQEAYAKPKIGAQLDLGSQGFNFEWGGYALLGVSVEIPIYAGKRNLLKIQQTKLELNALQEKKEQVRDFIALQATTNRNSLNAQFSAFNSYSDQIRSARRYYTDIQRRYREGQANFIEVLDARTQLTNAELQQSIARYKVWWQLAEIEFADAAYPIE